MTLMLQIINRKYLMNCAIDKEKTLRFFGQLFKLYTWDYEIITPDY